MKKRIRSGARRDPLFKKRRITLSLSARSVQFLENMRSETEAPSTSALVDQIIEDLQGRADLEKLDQQLKAHYDSRSESAGQEEREWGMTGENGLSSIADEQHIAPARASANER